MRTAIPIPVTLILITLGFGNAAIAQLRIQGESKIARDKLARLSAEGVPPKAGLLWKIYPAKGVDKADTPKGKLQFVAPPGQYVVSLIAVSIGADGTTEIEEAEFIVVVEEGSNPPAPPQPPTPPTPTPKYYFMLVRGDGPAHPTFTEIVAKPEWDQLRKQGHSVKDFTLTTARELGAVIPAGRNLPLVVTLKVLPDGSTIQVNQSDGSAWTRDLPATADGILKLAEGIP